MHDHWTLETIDWDAFDASKVDPELVKLARAASIVEANAGDYVDYLRKVFKGADAATLAVLERWGSEEVQHGAALARWAERADPNFNFENAFARFRQGYKPAHFIDADGSVRGSPAGEMVARCVVEVGTSSGYTALRDQAAEPVLKQIAGLIAADEFAHYRLFYDLMQAQAKRPPVWRRFLIAMSRVSESTDDELAYAYYSANLPEGAPYDRNACNRAYQGLMLALYRRSHILSLVGMVARAVGLHPESFWVKGAARLVWRIVAWRKSAPGGPVFRTFADAVAQ
jgi:hypothetical protein